jgi:hypothetical protein
MGNEESRGRDDFDDVFKGAIPKGDSASTPLLAAAPPKVTKIRTLYELSEQPALDSNRNRARIRIPKGAVLLVTGSSKGEHGIGPSLVASYTDKDGRTFTNMSIYDRYPGEDGPSYEKITNGGRRRKNSKRRKNLRTRRSRK